MKTFGGLFGGVNTGGRNKLPMKELVSLMEGVGLKNVSTCLMARSAGRLQQLAADL